MNRNFFEWKKRDFDDYKKLKQKNKPESSVGSYMFLQELLYEKAGCTHQHNQ